MVKSRKDKNRRKSSKFRGKSRKNIKVGRKSFRRKMTGGAGGWDKTKGLVNNLTGVSTRQLWHNMRGSKYQSARLKPYIDGIDKIFSDSENIDYLGGYHILQNQINELFHGSNSILTELQPYINTKFAERKTKDNEREIETARERKKHLIQLEINNAKIDIDNIFKDTNKSAEELQCELMRLILKIDSIESLLYGSYTFKAIEPYIKAKFDDLIEKNSGKL